MQSAMASKAGVGPGSCQRIFDLGARSVDLDLLDEWEKEQNGEKSGAGETSNQTPRKVETVTTTAAVGSADLPPRAMSSKQ